MAIQDALTQWSDSEVILYVNEHGKMYRLVQTETRMYDNLEKLIRDNNDMTDHDPFVEGRFYRKNSKEILQCILTSQLANDFLTLKLTAECTQEADGRIKQQKKEGCMKSRQSFDVAFGESPHSTPMGLVVAHATSSKPRKVRAGAERTTAGSGLCQKWSRSKAGPAPTASAATPRKFGWNVHYP
jgi:hypothetical protein